MYIIFTCISFSTTSSKVDLGQTLCFATSELLSSSIMCVAIKLLLLWLWLWLWLWLLFITPGVKRVVSGNIHIHRRGCSALIKSYHYAGRSKSRLSGVMVRLPWGIHIQTNPHRLHSLPATILSNTSRSLMTLMWDVFCESKIDAVFYPFHCY